MLRRNLLPNNAIEISASVEIIGPRSDQASGPFPIGWERDIDLSFSRNPSHQTKVLAVDSNGGIESEGNSVNFAIAHKKLVSAALTTTVSDIAPVTAMLHNQPRKR